MVVTITLAAVASTVLVQQPSMKEWEVELDFEVGRDRDGFTLGRVADLTVGLDESIYVLELFDRTVHILDSNGTHVKSFGRQGGGPGEFQAPSEIGWIHDTLWVRDQRLRRLTLFDRTGNVISTLSITSEARHPFRPTVASALLAGRAALIEPSGGSTMFHTASGILSVPLLLQRWQDEPVDTLAWMPLKGKAFAIQGPSYFQLRTPQPFSDIPLWSVVPGGDGFLILDRTVGNSPGGAQLEWYDHNGQRVRIQQYIFPADELSERVADSLVRAVVEEVTASSIWTASKAAAERAVREGFYQPDYLPSVTELIAGRDGTVWLRMAGPPLAAADWRVLDASGDPVADVHLPERFRAFQADQHHVWGIYYDQLNVAYVRRYSVIHNP